MKIQVKTDRPYAVTIQRGVLDQAGALTAQVKKPGCQVMIVSDSNVFPLYGQRVIASLEGAGFRVSQFVFPAGEEHKQIATVCQMYEALAQNGFTRSDLLLTLGGGVAGDMGGFAAATYLRGIPFVQVPTTLLSQVDASVGGKTGVDLPFGKNLVGAFHQPLAVLADPDTLQTLPERYFRDGMGEVIKYGCIQAPDLFQALEQGTALEDLESVLAQCVACKKILVEEDARDGEALSEAMRTLGKENQQLKAQLEEAQSAKSRQGEEESRRRVCQELERERDGLIQDIKDLRAYREEFRKAVAKEAQDLLGQVEGLPSKTLL